MHLQYNESTSHWPLGVRRVWRLFRAWSLKSLFALLIFIVCARGEFGAFPSLSLLEVWSRSNSSGPRIVRRTRAFAFFFCRLNKPLMDDTKPSPARSLCLRCLIGNRSPFALRLSVLSSEPSSLSTSASMGTGCAGSLSLNFLPCMNAISISTPIPLH